jgi:hypothetical protein
MCGECQKMHEGKVGDTVECECGEEFELEMSDFAEPLAFVLDDGSYKASCEPCGDIFVMKSPYFTYAQFCSPCAPGACHLMNPLDTVCFVLEDSEPIADNKCYCFGHDWFDDNKAPYQVFSVRTGKLVKSGED